MLMDIDMTITLLKNEIRARTVNLKMASSFLDKHWLSNKNDSVAKLFYII